MDILGAAGDTNIQGEDQQKLDVLANEKFIQTLKNREIVCGIASEEEDDFITVNSLDERHKIKVYGSSDSTLSIFFQIYWLDLSKGWSPKKSKLLARGKLLIAEE